MKSPKLLLFDANNLIFRSFHAIKFLSTSDGIPTNAVYGVLKSFRATISEFHPDCVIVCWDSGKKTFRHNQDSTYKANRPVTHDDLKTQFALVQEAFRRLGVPQMVADGVECDDLIGTLAVKSAEQGMDVTIVSSDKDFYQLCRENINVYSYVVKRKDDTGIVDVKYVEDNFGVSPSQLVDVKSLTGEKTDNIQGVNGIGPKIATKLIQQHGDIFNVIKILKNNKVIPEKYKVILNSLETIAMAYHLAKIKTDVVIPPVPVMMTEKIEIDAEQLREFFTRLEFHQFLTEFQSWANLFKYKITLV